MFWLVMVKFSVMVWFELMLVGMLRCVILRLGLW